MTALTSFPACNMDFQMLRTGKYLEVARRIIERIAVDMVNVLFGLQFAAKESLHNDAVFGLVMSWASQDVAISIFDVLAGKYPRANRLSVSTHEGVVVLAKTFGDCRQLTILNRAGGGLVAIQPFRHKWVAVFVPTLVMLRAKGTTFDRYWIRTFFHRTFLIHDTIVSRIEYNARSYDGLN